MDNATDALIMAGSVLLLIVALTVSISSLTNIRQQFQGILDTRDQIELAKNGDEYINYLKNDTDIRTVEIETIISTIRRMRKESYTIYIYADATAVDNFESSKYKETIIETKIATKYGNKTLIPKNKKIIQLNLKNTNLIFLDPEEYYRFTGFVYNELKGEKYEEYIGIYEPATSEDVPSADKEKDIRKIITFKQQGI